MLSVNTSQVADKEEQDPLKKNSDGDFLGESTISAFHDNAPTLEHKLGENQQSIHALLSETLKILQEFKSLFRAKELQEDIADEWREVAIVMDRLFFIIVSSATILVTMVILLQQSDQYSHLDALDYLA